MDTITVKGKNSIDAEIRYDALSELNGLSTLVLKRLAQLAESEKAVAYLKNPVKFRMIKTMIS